MKSPLRRLVLLSGVASFALVAGARADSATWKPDPTSNDWNTAANWTPEKVPSRLTQDAIFGDSNVTEVSISEVIKLGSIVFDAEAPAYTIDVKPIGVVIGGAGVMNDSGSTQSFHISGNLTLNGAAHAGDNVTYTAEERDPDQYQKNLVLEGSSSADSAQFIVNGDSLGLPGGRPRNSAGDFVEFPRSIGLLGFGGSSTAANSTIILKSGATAGGQAVFQNVSSAGNSHITVEAGAAVGFAQYSTAANSTILVKRHGRLAIDGWATGDACRVILRPGGTLASSGFSGTLKIGSLEGEGSVYVGKYGELTVGGNGLSTTFGGTIESSTLGRLVKTGDESLTLSGLNTYPGGTTVEGGALLVDYTAGSATGTGPVEVEAGTFGGRSNIAGAVSIGSGSGAGAYLAPGLSGPGILSIKNTLTFNADSTYECDLNLKNSNADQVVCEGVTIASGAQFALQATGNQVLPAGTVFTVINNQSGNAISGTFSNLVDGSSIVAGPNTLQVSYEGGDGNDLTLTVQ